VILDRADGLGIGDVERQLADAERSEQVAEVVLRCDADHRGTSKADGRRDRDPRLRQVVEGLKAASASARSARSASRRAVMASFSLSCAGTSPSHVGHVPGAATVPQATPSQAPSRNVSIIAHTIDDTLGTHPHRQHDG
jgi:hypothetical protein